MTRSREYKWRPKRHTSNHKSSTRGGGGEAPRAAAQVAETAEQAVNSRSLRRLLEGIGAPPRVPFVADEFQLEALAALEHEDVLVTAPTGSGKTWIAREEIRRLLNAGRRAWYTSPLKALTNSKYQEFIDEFGTGNVGILTGDRKENPDAPIIIGTTEVYRNQLFDALRSGRTMLADLVVMDEAHYLGDGERGHVWEEAIVLTPPRVRLLLLSATVGNAAEFAEWIAEVRGHACRVVARYDQGGARPVPLRAAFLYPEGELTPLIDEAGRLNSEIVQRVQRANKERRTPHASGSTLESRLSKLGISEMPPGTVLSALGIYDLLPAIMFLPTRRQCDEAAAEAAHTRQDGDAKRREARRDFLRRIAEQHPEVRKHRHWDVVIKGGVAAHHAGHLPAWKLAIEKLMSANLLDAIFATATVAAGVDFPARTVVLTSTDVRTGRGWRGLTASEFQQMTGRAGRRGRDQVGFIVAAPGLHQNLQRVAALLGAPADALESQFRATYTTLLNLLDAYGNLAHVREIAERSFARREAAKQITRLTREQGEAEERIQEQLETAGCPLPVRVARGLERLVSARTRLLEQAPQTRSETMLRWLDETIVPGRVVSIGRSGRRLVFVTERRGHNFAGMREDGRSARLALERVGRVYKEIHARSQTEREAAFASVRSGEAVALDEPRLHDARRTEDAAVGKINDLIDQLLTENAGGNTDDNNSERNGISNVSNDGGGGGGGSNNSGSSAAHQRAGGAASSYARALWAVVNDAAELASVERQAAALRDEVWRPFERRAQVLQHFGYIDLLAEQVTEPGRWLADLRVDRPLLVGEALKKNLFADLDAPSVAGLMAALAADAERSYGELALDDKLIATLVAYEEIADEVAKVEWEQNLEPAPEINYSAAAAAASWARGVRWDDLVRRTAAEEGDLFRMLARTGESLLQISGLRQSQPTAARIAADAAERILREPVR